MLFSDIEGKDRYYSPKWGFIFIKSVVHIRKCSVQIHKILIANLQPIPKSTDEMGVFWNKIYRNNASIPAGTPPHLLGEGILADQKKKEQA